MKIKQGSALDLFFRIFIYSDEVSEEIDINKISGPEMKELQESQSRINEMENGFGISKGLVKNGIVEKVKVDSEKAIKKAEEKQQNKDDKERAK